MVYEIAVGHVARRGRLVLEKDLPGRFSTSITAYHSLFTYEEEEIKHHLKKHGRIARFRGVAGIPFIIIDLDRGSQTDAQVLEKARDFIRNLDAFYVTDYQIWFSGTGYHIQIPNLFGIEPSPEAPRTLKASMLAMWPGIDSIYDHTRLIRMPWSINPKSGLHKVPVSANDLLNKDVSYIWNLAKNPIIDTDEWLEWTADPVWKHLTKHIRHGELPKDWGEISSYVGCMQVLFNEGPGDTLSSVPDRIHLAHNKLVRLASAWRRQGVPLSGSIILAKHWAGEKHSNEDAEKVCRDIYEHAYKYGCNDEIMLQYCVGSSCKFFHLRNFNREQDMDISAQWASFAKFRDSDWKKHSLNLGEYMPDIGDFWVKPGEVVYLAANTGLNKTTLMQNLAVYWKRPLLYLNLEMSFTGWFRRQIQIQLGVDKERAFNITDEEAESVKEALAHIHHRGEALDAATLESMIYDLKTEITIVDTADCILVPNMGQNTYYKGDSIARAMSEIARRTDTIVFVVVHLNKEGMKRADTKRIRLADIAGPGTFVQKADLILAISGDRNDTKRSLYSIKARDNEPMDTTLTFDPETFRMI